MATNEVTSASVTLSRKLNPNKPRAGKRGDEAGLTHQSSNDRGGEGYPSIESLAAALKDVE